jgi:ketosteroid isomerase-like protein
MTLMVLFAWFVAFPSMQASQADADVATLTRLEIAWNDAHKRGDAKALADLFADDMEIIVPGMRAMTKADGLGVFASGGMKFDRYETSDTKIRVYDTTAVVTGRMHRTRTMGDRMLEDDWRFTKVYVRRANRWQVVSFHASNVAP